MSAKQTKGNLNCAGATGPRRPAGAAAVPRARPLKGFQPGARAVGSFVPKLTRKAFEKYGFSAATLLTDWAAIAGPELAAYTLPDRLKWPRGVEIYADPEVGGTPGRPGATLVLRVDGARALEVQYKAGQIMERINAYFGYRAVSELRILQAPLAGHRAQSEKALVGPEPEPVAPRKDVAAIQDRPLRAALEKMAAGLSRRKSWR